MLVSDFTLYALKKDKDMPQLEELLSVARGLSESVIKLSKRFFFFFFFFFANDGRLQRTYTF